MKKIIITIIVIAAMFGFSGCGKAPWGLNDGAEEHETETDFSAMELLFDTSFIKIYKQDDVTLKILYDGVLLTAKHDEKINYLINTIAFKDEYEDYFYMNESTGEIFEFYLSCFCDANTGQDEELDSASLEKIRDSVIDEIGFIPDKYRLSKHEYERDICYEYIKYISDLAADTEVKIGIDKYGGRITSYKGTNINKFDKFDDVVIDKDYYYNLTKKEIENITGVVIEPHLHIENVFLSEDENNLVVVAVFYNGDQLWEDDGIDWSSVPSVYYFTVE